ncbi:MAG: hypothetical protein HY290_02975 [Planctomycetia bacterium]|nr:hypothetical protein [Planctomycetia bacterium]
MALSEQDVQEDAGGAWNPSLNLLGDFHSEEQFKFANPSTYGHVKDRDHVAGFVSHGFSKLPVLKHPQNDWIKVQGKSKSVESHPAAWKIVRLELVSLLKFDEPAVYVSDHLPQMSELADAKTRPLTPFEEQALESLQAGEYLVAAADTNHIRMLGSLRASKQCLECHAGRRGTLLGAFSYRLRRDPPLSVTTSGKKPAT